MKIDTHKLSAVVMMMLIATFTACPLFADDSGTATDAKPVKNVILMIADGAGFNTFQAAADLKIGPQGAFPQADFPVHVGMTTYAVTKEADGISTPDASLQQTGYDPAVNWKSLEDMADATARTATTDSAAAATVLNTGVKTKNGRIGMAFDGKTRLESIAEIADKLGKATGAITTVETCHATPAGVAAHNESRNNYSAIFKEMVYESPLDVIMGAGHPLVDAAGDTLEKPNYKYVGDEATWDDMTDEDGAAGFTFIDQAVGFKRLANAKAGAKLPTKVLGIALAPETIGTNRDAKIAAGEQPTVPTLADMSRGALNVLNQDSDGFFLMIEGGAIDWAGHANDLPRMLREMEDFEQAVTTVIDWVETNSSWDETLLIITADHETGRLWGENTFTDKNGNKKYDKGDQFNGLQPIENRGEGQLPGYQYTYGSHSNQLVPLWAKGPASERFLTLVRGKDERAAKQWEYSGEYIDNTDVFKVMKAAIVGE